MQILDDNARLQKELAITAVEDAERIMTINKALEETVTQVLINQVRMSDHMAADHQKRSVAACQDTTHGDPIFPDQSRNLSTLEP